MPKANGCYNWAVRSSAIQYFVLTLTSWGRAITGPLVTVVTIVLALTSAHYAGDPKLAVVATRDSAWLTGLLSVMLIFKAQYDVWKNEYCARQSSEMKLNTVADIRGEIYLQ